MRSTHPLLAIAVVALALVGCAQEVGPAPARSVTCAAAQDLPCPVDAPRLYEVRVDLGFGEAPSATLQSKGSEAEVTYVGRSAATDAVRLPSPHRGRPLFLVALSLVPLALLVGFLMARSRSERLRGIGRGIVGGTVLLGAAGMLVVGLSASPGLVIDNASAQHATVTVQGLTVALPPKSFARVSVTYPASLDTRIGGEAYETVVVEDPFALSRRWRRLGSKETAFVYSIGGQARYTLQVAKYVKR